MKTLVYILGFASCIMAREPDCLKQKYALFGRLRSEVIKLELDGSKKIQISWKHLVGDMMECIKKVELSDHTGEVLESKEFRTESKDEAQFEQDFDMCRDYSKALFVSFYINIGDKLEQIDSQEVKINSDEFLKHNKYLPICPKTKKSEEKEEELYGLSALFLVGLYIFISWVILFVIVFFIHNKICTS
jgi:hypothetical protein